MNYTKYAFKVFVKYIHIFIYIRVIRSGVSHNNFLGCLFLPLNVSALVGHLQAEYTTISGSYFTYNGSVVLYYY
jgi:hypothetical protein